VQLEERDPLDETFGEDDTFCFRPPGAKHERALSGLPVIPSIGLPPRLSGNGFVSTPTT